MLILMGPVWRYATNLIVLHLRKKKVPRLQCAIDVDGGQAHDDVVLDGFHRRFYCVHTVVVWFHNLDVGAIAFDKYLHRL